MFCSNCGTENKMGSAFCSACGQRLSETVPAPVVETPVEAAAPVVEAPVAAPVVEVPVAAPVVKKAKKPLLSKKTAVDILLYFILAALCFGVVFTLLKLFTVQEAIGVNSLYEKEIHGYLTVKEFCEMLLKGNAAFNPTAASTALAIAAYLLIFGAPALIALSFIGTAVFGNRFSFLHILSVIYSVVAALFVAMLAPLSKMLVPELTVAIAKQQVMLAGDVGGLEFIKPIIFGVIVLLITVALIVLTTIVNKRRLAK